MKRKLSALLASLVLVLGLLAPLASTVSAAGKKKVSDHLLSSLLLSSTHCRG